MDVHAGSIHVSRPSVQKNEHHGLRSVRSALTCCMLHVTVYMPNKMLQIMQEKIMDSVGFDDAIRASRQHILEKDATDMLLLLDRGLDSSDTVLRHMSDSSFIEKLAAWLYMKELGRDPPEGRKPTLTLAQFRWVGVECASNHPLHVPCVRATLTSLPTLIREVRGITPPDEAEDLDIGCTVDLPYIHKMNTTKEFKKFLPKEQGQIEDATRG